MNPYFSIVIPSYNRAYVIGETIRNVLDQDFADWELIVVDDGSTDHTEEVVRTFSDPRIRYYKKENGERGAARNFGAAQARGQYINFFDSDDQLYPFHLSAAFQALHNQPEVKCLCFPWEYYTADGKYAGRRSGFNGDLNAIIRRKNYIHLNGCFIARPTFSAHPFIPDRTFNICEDWYFFLNLSFFEKLYGIDQPTTKYILHAESTMNNMKPESFHVALHYFEKLLADKPVSASDRRCIFGELYSMLSLAYAMNRRRAKSIHYLWKATRFQPARLFSKRTLGILKNLLHAKRRG